MIVPLTEAHARYVCEHIQDIERREREAIYAKPFATQWYLPILLGWAAASPAYACLKNDAPAVIGGISIEDKIGIPWMLCTDQVNDVVIELTRACRKAVQRLKECGMIEKMVVSSVDFHLDAHRWYRLLGLTKTGDVAGPAHHKFYLFEG